MNKLAIALLTFGFSSVGFADVQPIQAQCMVYEGQTGKILANTTLTVEKGNSSDVYQAVDGRTYAVSLTSVGNGTKVPVIPLFVMTISKNGVKVAESYTGVQAGQKVYAGLTAEGTQVFSCF